MFALAEMLQYTLLKKTIALKPSAHFVEKPPRALLKENRAKPLVCIRVMIGKARCLNAGFGLNDTEIKAENLIFPNNLAVRVGVQLAKSLGLGTKLIRCLFFPSYQQVQPLTYYYNIEQE